MTSIARCRWAACMLAGGLASLPLGAGSPVAGQALLQRIRAASDGTVRLAFAVRPQVRGDDHNVYVGRDSPEWEPDRPRAPGLAHTAVDVREHRIVAIRVHVGGHWRAVPGVSADFGQVPASEAATAFLELARLAPERIARRALIVPALADSAEVWPQLLELARDSIRPLGVRRDATFWLSQQAARAATRGLADIAENPGQREVRHAAIFALSQRPHDEGLPALLHIARTSHDPDVLRQAIFWLGQSNDPRALDYLRELLGVR